VTARTVFVGIGSSCPPIRRTIAANEFETLEGLRGTRRQARAEVALGMSANHPTFAILTHAADEFWRQRYIVRLLMPRW